MRRFKIAVTIMRVEIVAGALAQPGLENTPGSINNRIRVRSLVGKGGRVHSGSGQGERGVISLIRERERGDARNINEYGEFADTPPATGGVHENGAKEWGESGGYINNDGEDLLVASDCCCLTVAA